MKTQDQPQELIGIGKKIEPPPPKPKPHEKVRDGVFKDGDGNLYTVLPEPLQPSIFDAFKKAGMP